MLHDAAARSVRSALDPSRARTDSKEKPRIERRRRKALKRRSHLQQSFRLHGAALNRKVVRGAGFQFAGTVLRVVITIGSTAMLARLLTPQDFGLVAMATVITEFAALFGAVGLTNVLIQRARITRLQLDTVFWAMLGIGTVLAAVVVALSWMSEWLFADPAVGSLLRFLCLNFIISSLGSVPWVVLSRTLRFDLQFLVDAVTVVVRTMVAVLAAWLGIGVWSLVIGALTGAVVSVVVSFLFVPYWPRWRFDASLIVRSWRTSSSYFGSTALYYATCNLDLIVIGRGLGTASLGLYQNARSLTDEIRARIAMPIQHVLFPAFSILQAEPGPFRELVLRASRLIAAVVVPVGVGVSANAAELVLVLYGSQWVGMTPVMVMFGLSAALRASTAIASALFNAKDLVGRAFRFNLVSTTLLVLAVVAAIPWGIEGVAVAVALASVYSLFVMRAAFRTIDLGWASIQQVLGPPALAALLMWLTVHGLRNLGWTTTPALALAVHVLAGAFVYVASLLLLSSQVRVDAKTMIATLRPVGGHA